MSCPKCGKAWQRVKDAHLVCSCGYIEQPRANYDQILAENKQLLIRIATLEKDIAFYKKMWLQSADMS